MSNDRQLRASILPLYPNPKSEPPAYALPTPPPTAGSPPKSHNSYFYNHEVADKYTQREMATLSTRQRGGLDLGGHHHDHHHSHGLSSLSSYLPVVALPIPWLLCSPALHSTGLASGTLAIVLTAIALITITIATSFTQSERIRTHRRTPSDPSYQIPLKTKLIQISMRILSLFLPFYASLHLGGISTALILILGSSIFFEQFNNGLNVSVKVAVEKKYHLLLLGAIIIQATEASAFAFLPLLAFFSIIGLHITSKNAQYWPSFANSAPNFNLTTDATTVATFLAFGSIFVFSMTADVDDWPNLVDMPILIAAGISAGLSIIYVKKSAPIALAALLTAISYPLTTTGIFSIGAPICAISTYFMLKSGLTESKETANGHMHVHSHTPIKASAITNYLLSQTTPGSMVHSILSVRDSRRIAYFGVVNLAFMFVQFFYGYLTGSLGLLTDSIHMLFDCIALAVGLAAAVMARWPESLDFPYGYAKVEALSGFANGIFLCLVSVEIVFDALHRLHDGVELKRLDELLVVSALGLFVNLLGLTAFGHHHHGGHDHGHDHSNENMQGIFLHIVADALGSVAVIVSTLLTKYNSWTGWDPLASVLIAIAIFASAVPLVKAAGWNLMVRLDDEGEWSIKETLRGVGSVRGVVGYAGVRIWRDGRVVEHSHDHDHDHNHHHEQEHQHGHDHDHDHAHAHAHEHEHEQSHSHDHHTHDHKHTPDLQQHDPFSHAHSPNHDHDHDHSHDHSHDHAKESKGRFVGSIHIIAENLADQDEVRKRVDDFLRQKGWDVVLQVERQIDTRCWCRRGNTSL
jgi:zinc transporter 5/7